MADTARAYLCERLSLRILGIHHVRWPHSYALRDRRVRSCASGGSPPGGADGDPASSESRASARMRPARYSVPVARLPARTSGARVRRCRVNGFHRYVTVRVRCRSCGLMRELCVAIERNVPSRLRCSPGGGTGGSVGGGWPCARCSTECFRSVEELVRAVMVETRGSWEPHLRRGFVLVQC